MDTPYRRSVDHVAAFLTADWERLFRAAPKPLAFCDRALRIAAANDSFAQLVRSTPCELAGLSIAEATPGLAAALTPILKRAIDDGRPILKAEIEGELRERTDQRRWWEVDAQAVEGGVVLALEDISGAKANEERVELLNAQLRRRVAELETLLHVIPIGISIARDPKCRVVTNNAYQARLMGHPPGENASIDPEAPDRQSSYRVYRGAEEMSADELPMHRALAELREVEEVEFDVVVRDGRKLTMLGYGAPLFDESGAARGAIAAFVDITARKRAESALKDSERRFRVLAEAIPHVVWTASATGGVAYVNSRWREVTGRPTFDCLGAGWESALHPDDRDACHARWKAALASRDVLEAEARLRCHDGAWRWHLIRAVPFVREERDEAQWFGTMTDIDAQKRVDEEREHVLVLEKVARAEAEHARRRAKLLDDAMHTLASSLDYDAAVAAIPRLAVGELADLAVLEVLEEDDRVRRVAHANDGADRVAVTSLTRALDAASPNRLWAMSGGRADFEPFIDQTWLASSFSDGASRRAIQALGVASLMSVPLAVRGRVVGALTVAFTGARRHTRADRALAEQLAARAALAIENARLYREAQAASIAKDQFVAAVSHELRTPLAAILGWTRILQRKSCAPEMVAKAVGVIDRNANLQARLIEDLLDLVRASTSNFVLTRRAMNLAASVSAAVDTLLPEAEERGIALSIATPSAPVEVFGDPERLQQVAWNLVSNALKFTQRGGRVAVVVTSNGAEARLEVKDDGQGIPSEFIPHVFQPFQQARRSDERRGGLGLGLAIVRQIVEMHGGNVAAHSDGPGHGARFVVALPNDRGDACPG